jgi:hypothetical protein
VSAATEDPLGLIIGAGGAAIGTLSLIVWSMLLAQVKQLRADIKETSGHLSGNDGMFPRFARLEGRTATVEAEVAALKVGTLSRERFDEATKGQNEKLEGLRSQARELDLKVEKIDRTLMPPPRGSAAWPAGK